MLKTFKTLQYNITCIFDINSINWTFCSMHDFISKTLSLNLCHCYLKCRRLNSLLAPHQYLRRGYLIFQNFWEAWKGTWYHKTFDEHRQIRKIKDSHVNCFITYMFTGLLFITEDMKKINYKCLNEMKC